MGPRRLTPSLREKVWGSTALEPWFAGAGAKIGEVWFEGVPDLPLLVKFVFTTEKLSVQVHPGDEYARAHHNSPGKTEMWHVLAAQPGARIAAGFRAPLSSAQLRGAAQSGAIEDLLAWFDAKAGDTFFIPAGTVHAIGPGLTLCEIQQHSDITYRLYDYGRPRELHLEHALAVSNRDPCNPRAAPNGDVLASCAYFTTRLVGSGIHKPSPSDFLIAIDGAGTIGGAPVRAGEVWYVPSPGEPLKIPLVIEGDVRLLVASPPAQ